MSLRGVADRFTHRGVGEKVQCVNLLWPGETEKMWMNEVNSVEFEIS